MNMRLDYIMYAIAVLFFIITATAAIPTIAMETTQRNLWVVSTVVLGLLSIGFGYFQRPKAMVHTSQSNTPASETVTPQTIQASTQTKATFEKPSLSETTMVIEPLIQTSTIAVTTSNLPAKPAKRSQVKKIKGIGKKRAAQLNSLGIYSYKELANASAENVAKNLKISPKTVNRWISEAKERIK